MLLLLVLSLPLLRAAPSFSSSAEGKKNNCFELLQSAGATDSFGVNVGHAIHSITVRALRKFEPRVTEKNRVPTINLNGSSNEAILPYAPDRKGPSADMYLSEGMKTLDEVLSHMDDKKYDINFFSPLEKVVHAFHMEEAWAMTKVMYDKIKKDPPSEDVCKCAMDVEKNGVLKMLRFSALAIREPLLIYGNHLDYYKTDPDTNGYYVQYNYNFMAPKEWGQTQLTPEQMLMKQEQAMPRLTNEASWEKWKEIGMMNMEEHKNTALFLYCALKE